jgi:hypothetical protein
MRALLLAALAACVHAPPVIEAPPTSSGPAVSPDVTIDGAGWDVVCADATTPQLRPLPFGSALFLCGDERGRVVVLWPDGEVAADVDTAFGEPVADGWVARVAVRPHPVPVDDQWRDVACSGDLAASEARFEARTEPAASAWHVSAMAAVAVVRRVDRCLERVVASCPPVAPPPASGPTLRCGPAKLSFAHDAGRLVVVHEDNRGLATLGE